MQVVVVVVAGVAQVLLLPEGLVAAEPVSQAGQLHQVRSILEAVVAVVAILEPLAALAVPELS